MDFLKQLIAEHFLALLVVGLTMFTVVAILGIALFKALRDDPEKGAKALFYELSFVRGFVGIFKKGGPAPVETRSAGGRRGSLSDLTITPQDNVPVTPPPVRKAPDAEPKP